MAIRRRELLQGILAALPAVGIGRAFEKSALLPEAVERIGANLPLATEKNEWHLYETSGQFLFTVYGDNGGPAAKEMCWLIRERGNEHYAIPIEFSSLMLRAIDYNEEAIRSVVVRKFADAILRADVLSVKVDLDGGNLPMPGDQDRPIEVLELRDGMTIGELVDFLRTLPRKAVIGLAPDGPPETISKGRMRVPVEIQRVKA